jgi:hypothetical protein
VLTASLALDEVERVAGINDQLAEVNAAWLTAYAVNKPDELSRAEYGVRRRMKLVVIEAGELDEAAMAGVVATVQRAVRIERRKRKGG